jgi:hypothetical protein
VDNCPKSIAHDIISTISSMATTPHSTELFPAVFFLFALFVSPISIKLSVVYSNCNLLVSVFRILLTAVNALPGQFSPVRAVNECFKSNFALVRACAFACACLRADMPGCPATRAAGAAPGQDPAGSRRFLLIKSN